jgi:hypothetical protein
MRKLITVLVFALVLASLVAKAKGIDLPIHKTFGFSSGG